MRVIEEFSFDEEPGKTQVKSNITESVEKPNISIVTPFYNAEQNFIQTYYCVVNQSMEAFEWIIVDDGSSRPSAVELLEEYGKKDARDPCNSSEKSRTVRGKKQRDKKQQGRHHSIFGC